MRKRRTRPRVRRIRHPRRTRPATHHPGAAEFNGFTTLLTTAEVPVARGQPLFVQLTIAGAPLGRGAGCSLHAACLIVQGQRRAGRCALRPARVFRGVCDRRGARPFTLCCAALRSADLADNKYDSAAYILPGSLTVHPSQITIATSASKARERRWAW